MPLYNIVATLLGLAIGAGVALVIYTSLSGSLCRFLNGVMGIPDGAIFFLRALFLVLFLTPFGNLTSVQKPDAHFMEYVWAIASGISSSINQFVWTLLVFVGLIALLASVLRSANAR